MTVLAAYRQARHDEEVARLRRGLALRAMVASGMSQREIAAELGVSQPAVSQQLKVAQDLARLHPADLVEAAGPVLRSVADDAGYRGLRICGSWRGAVRL